MRTTFSGIYTKKENAGFVGHPAIVRTPSRSEVFSQVILALGSVLQGIIKDPKYLSEAGLKFYRDLDFSKSQEVVDLLVDGLYFEPCHCDNRGCRSWHQVYDVCNPKAIYCHVSECELEQYPPEKQEEEDPAPLDFAEGEVQLTTLIQDKIKGIMSDPNVVKACLDPNILTSGTPEYALFNKGYAEALQDIFNIITGVGASF